MDHSSASRSDAIKVPHAIARLACLITIFFAFGAVAACGGDARRPPTVEGAAGNSTGRAVPVADRPPFRFFAPTSIWNRMLPTDARIDPRSTGLVDALNADIAGERSAGGGPGINTVAYSVPIYTVSSNQPTVKVLLVDAGPKSALQSAWDVVPLPPNAQPATGTDKQLVVWQPSTDRLWEFWRLEHQSEGWQATWGGAIRNVSSNPGAYGPQAWPGGTGSWGASASSLSIAG